MRWLALLVVSACGFEPASVTGDSAPGDDGMPGSEPPTTPCYGTGLGVSVCPAVTPTAAYDVTGTTHIATDMGSGDCIALTGPTANTYCVVTGTSISITGFLYAHGTRPLVLLSLTTLDMSGTIDVASHRSGSPQDIGPGADDPGCGGTPASQSTSAGFGGTLGSMGGNGGTDMVHDGWADTNIGSTTLHGGCKGGQGLDASSGNAGGHGGGALDLIAEGSISVLGTINASGAGGGGAPPSNNGGGGGGAGGMIVLDTPLLTTDPAATIVYANGGGGGGGSSTSSSTASNGGDPSGYLAGGGGGGGIGSGGLGGDGAMGATMGGDGHNGTGGAGNGGGGGGTGIVRVFRATVPTSGHFSPTPQ